MLTKDFKDLIEYSLGGGCSTIEMTDDPQKFYTWLTSKDDVLKLYAGKIAVVINHGVIEKIIIRWPTSFKIAINRNCLELGQTTMEKMSVNIVQMGISLYYVELTFRGVAKRIVIFLV